MFPCYSDKNIAASERDLLDRMISYLGNNPAVMNISGDKYILPADCSFLMSNASNLKPLINYGMYEVPVLLLSMHCFDKLPSVFLSMSFRFTGSFEINFYKLFLILDLAKGFMLIVKILYFLIMHVFQHTLQHLNKVVSSPYFSNFVKY